MLGNWKLLRVLKTDRISKNCDLGLALVESCAYICLSVCMCGSSFVCVCMRGYLYLQCFSSFH